MAENISEVIEGMLTHKGERLSKVADEAPVLITFLRHLGCIFCMEAIKDIKKHRKQIESQNVKICLVHMASPEIGDEYFEEYGLSDVMHVSDPECMYYEKFGLIKGKFNQLFGLQTWLRTAQIAVQDLSSLKRKQIGDGLQMPGVFVVHKGNVLASYVHRRASDRPNYVELINRAK